MSIEIFKANLKYGIARPHSYNVIMQSPDRGISPEIGMFAEQAEIPGKAYATGNLGIYGPSVKFPYQEIFIDLKISFICSSDFWERIWFDEWQNRISNPKSGYFYYPDTYTRDIMIQQLDGNGRIVYEGVAKKAWPIAIEPMPLAYGEVNTYHKLGVVFAYSRFLDTYTDGTKSGDSGVPGSRSPGQAGGGNLPVPPTLSPKGTSSSEV